MELRRTQSDVELGLSILETMRTQVCNLLETGGKELGKGHKRSQGKVDGNAQNEGT